MGSIAQYRRAEVEACQHALNMTPRTDSRLTEMYVRGETTLSADEVARELMAVDFVYRNTLYGDVIEDFMRACAHRVRERHGLSWTTTWRIVRIYAPLALRLMMLSASGLRIPEAFPPRVPNAAT